MSSRNSDQTKLQTFASLFGPLIQTFRLDLPYDPQFDPALFFTSFPNIKFLEISGSVTLHMDQIYMLVAGFARLQYLKFNCSSSIISFWQKLLETLSPLSIKELDISGCGYVLLFILGIYIYLLNLLIYEINAFNRLTQAVAIPMCTFLRNNRHLSVLSLANNPALGIEAVVQMAPGIESAVLLRILDISECGLVTSAKSEELLYNLPPLVHRLKVLKMNGNKFSVRATTFWQYILSTVSSHFIIIILIGE